jgi:hypothetical protein
MTSMSVVRLPSNAPAEVWQTFGWQKPQGEALSYLGQSPAWRALTNSADIAPRNLPFVVGGNEPKHRIVAVSTNQGLEERIFNSVVQLKVSIAQFAMHLSSDERERIFRQLDDVINVDDWHDEDELPKVESFRDLLRWAIHSSLYGWTSFGVADDGNILVAWDRPSARLTANFNGDGQVRWTSWVRSSSGTEAAHAAGKCPLAYFTRQARFTLGA